MPLAAFAARLSTRSLISVRGSDSLKFLQGLLTNDMGLLKEQPMLYAFMLTGQGRVLNDVFVYADLSSPADKPCYLLECDSGQRDATLQRLRFQKLRYKVDIDPNPSSVWCVGNLAGAVPAIHAHASAGQLGGRDSRFPAGQAISPEVSSLHRFVTDSNTSLPYDHVSADQYQLLRIKAGIGEGAEDMPVNSAMPLECNGDLLNGVSVTKGCYVGQELVARTVFLGTVRKRLLPVYVNGWTSSHGSLSGLPLAVRGSVDGRPGVIRSSAGAHALALVNVHASDLFVRCADGRELPVQPALPLWMEREKVFGKEKAGKSGE